MILSPYGDPVLETPAFDVTDFDDKKELIEAMFETMYAHNGVGLAAPQVGLPLRLYVFDDRAGFKGHMFNPFLMKGTGKKVLTEGCLSLPGLYLEDVVRSQKCIVNGLDLNAHRLSYSVDGLAAQIMQHEVDHLDGMLFTTRSKMTPSSVRLFDEWKMFHRI